MRNVDVFCASALRGNAIYAKEAEKSGKMPVRVAEKFLQPERLQNPITALSVEKLLNKMIMS